MQVEEKVWEWTKVPVYLCNDAVQDTIKNLDLGGEMG